MPGWIARHLDFLRLVWRDFNDDNGMLLAAAVAFYHFLSLIPLLLAAVGMAALVLGSAERAESAISHIIGPFGVAAGTKHLLAGIIRGRAAATGVGLVVSLWSGMTALTVLDRGVNLAWNVKHKRGVLQRRVVALVLLVTVLVLAVASVGITGLIKSARTGHRSVPLMLLAHLVALLISIAMFMVVYKLLPVAHVKWRTALVGGLFAGMLWELAKHAFAFYVVNFAAYDRVYGSLGGVILLLVWIDYSAIITILGAEFASNWQGAHRPAREPHRGRT